MLCAWHPSPEHSVHPCCVFPWSRRTCYSLSCSFSSEGRFPTAGKRFPARARPVLRKGWMGTDRTCWSPQELCSPVKAKRQHTDVGDCHRDWSSSGTAGDCSLRAAFLSLFSFFFKPLKYFLTSALHYPAAWPSF